LVTVLILLLAMTIQITMRLPHVDTVAMATNNTDHITCRHSGNA
jgi:hypothetical protein